MRAVQAPTPGGPEALTLVDIDRPTPTSGEVLIRVAAAGLNRADILQTAGFYPPPPGATNTLGLEVSGVIEAVATDVDSWQSGDRVMALLSGGGYAEYVSVPAGQVVAIPQGIDFTTAAGIMETYATVWSNVFMTAALRAGETLLVHGGGSGIGTTAIALAKSFGARVIATVGSERKAEVCRELGADLVINYNEEDFAEVVTNAGGADVILDIIGAKYLGKNIAALNAGGRLVVIGLQGGIVGELNLAALLTKRASVTATSLRSRPVEEKSAIVADVVERVLPLIESGKVRPRIDRTFALDEVAIAHEYLATSAHIGKVVLTVDSSL